MTRRRARVACAGALAALLVAAIPASADAAARPSCKRAGSKTLAKNSFARVYELGSKLIGCRRATGRRVVLYTAYDDEYTTSAFYGDVDLNGTFVAWSWETVDVSCKAACPPGYNPTNSGLSVFDLRRRRGRSVTPAEAAGEAFVVSRRGGLAWLEEAASGPGLDLHVSRRLAEDSVIDSGNIEPGSLAVELTIISWKRDGVERFARL